MSSTRVPVVRFRRVPSPSSTRRCRVNTPVRTRATATASVDIRTHIPRSNGARSPRRTFFRGNAARRDRILLDRGIRRTNREPLEPSIGSSSRRVKQISRAQRPTCQQSSLIGPSGGISFPRPKRRSFFGPSRIRHLDHGAPRAYSAPRRETAARDRIEASKRRYAIRRVTIDANK